MCMGRRADCLQMPKSSRRFKMLWTCLDRAMSSFSSMMR